MTDPRQPGSIAPSGLPPLQGGGMHRIVPGQSHAPAHPHAPAPAAGHTGHGAHGPADETIALVDGAPQQNTSKIKAFGIDAERRRDDWKRKAHVGGTGVCRVRTFHGKYSDTGLAHMDDMINEWLDSHPDVEVKFITSTVGVFEGKIREPALVLNVWY